MQLDPGPFDPLDVSDYCRLWYQVNGSRDGGSVTDQQLGMLGSCLGIHPEITRIAREGHGHWQDEEGIPILIRDLSQRMRDLYRTNPRTSVYLEVPSRYFADVLTSLMVQGDQWYLESLELHLATLRAVLIHMDPELVRCGADTSIYIDNGIPLVEPTSSWADGDEW